MTNASKAFIGKNLTFARNAKSLSVKELAEKIQIERQAIYNYEKSLRVPEHEILEKLSEILDKPILYFFKPLDESFHLNESESFFRKFTKQTELARSQSDIIGKEYFPQIVSYLYKFFDLPRETKIYRVTNNDDINSFSNERIEELATETRKRFGIGNNPISNLQLLLENNLCYVCKTDLISSDLNAFSFVGNENCFIIINSNKNKYSPRYRFTLGHELGHLVMHSSINDKEHLLQHHDIMEKQADYFSGAFLMPKETFLNDVFDVSINGLLALKQKWKVSVQAMIFRLFNLDVIDENKKTYLFKELSRKGMRITEPFDDKIEKEEPVFIKKAINKIAEEIGYEAILNDLLLGKVMIANLTGVEESMFSPKNSITANGSNNVICLDKFRRTKLQ